jgi:hypothetical protein
MLSEREQRALIGIEHALTNDDPRLARMLRGGTVPRRIGVTVAVGLLIALPTIAAGFVHPALALLVGSVTVIVLTVVALVRARPSKGERSRRD